MNKIICISRQFASGGREISEILAKKYNIPLIDSETIIKCVKRLGINENLVKTHDENAKNSLLYSIAMGYFGNHHVEAPGDIVFQAQAEVIRDFTEKGPCIIIGRCAGEILHDNPNCKRIFIYADMEFRQKRVEEKYGYDTAKVKKILQQKDKERAAYHTRYAEHSWGSLKSFDLAVNTSCSGIEGAVDVISAFIEHR